MILYIVRHAWAGEQVDPQWPDDSQRPLTEAGKTRFARVAEILAGRGLNPEVVATSPYRRCRQTAEIIAAIAPSRPQVVPVDHLAPDGDPGRLVAWTAAESSRWERIAWVGHAPDVGDLAAALVSDRGASIHFSKGAVAAIEFEGAVALGGGELQWLVTAKVLGC
ncbi:MAG: SixA phosphatase family protein [Thermoguttaceae bacterium]